MTENSWNRIIRQSTVPYGPNLRKLGDTLYFYCEGCDEYHGFNTTWSVTNHDSSVTVHPSIGVYKRDGLEGFQCHSFIRDGHVHYLGDCVHDMRSQTVKMRIEE